MDEIIFDYDRFREQNARPIYAPNEGFFLLLSIDMTNSTSFKNNHPEIWTEVFLSFYGEILFRLNLMKQFFSDNHAPIKAGLWKVLGDEVLLYMHVDAVSQLYPVLVIENELLKSVITKNVDIISQRHKQAGASDEECMHIRDAILSELGIKTTAWVADCFSPYSNSVPNVSFSMDTVDFIGTEIDEGFRLAKYARPNVTLVSPYLAWLIQKEHKGKPILLEHASLKGVWDGVPVPILGLPTSKGNDIPSTSYSLSDLEKELSAIGKLDYISFVYETQKKQESSYIKERLQKQAFLFDSLIQDDFALLRYLSQIE